MDARRTFERVSLSKPLFSPAIIPPCSSPSTPTEQRIQRELARGHYTDAAQVIHRALDLLDAQEDWLLRNREAIYERIEESVSAAERGELYTAEEARSMLAERRHNRAS